MAKKFKDIEHKSAAKIGDISVGDMEKWLQFKLAEKGCSLHMVKITQVEYADMWVVNAMVDPKNGTAAWINGVELAGLKPEAVGEYILNKILPSVKALVKGWKAGYYPGTPASTAPPKSSLIDTLHPLGMLGSSITTSTTSNITIGPPGGEITIGTATGFTPGVIETAAPYIEYTMKQGKAVETTPKPKKRGAPRDMLELYGVRNLDDVKK